MEQGIVALLVVCTLAAILSGSWLPLLVVVMVLVSLAAAKNGPP